MTVGKLRAQLKDVPDEADVLVPTEGYEPGKPVAEGAKVVEHHVCTRDILNQVDLDVPEHFVFIH